MNVEVKKQIVEALEGYMTGHSLSQNEVAKRSGVNASYIIEMRKGNFTMNAGGKEVEISGKYFEKIAELVGFEIRKNYWKTRETEQLAEALEALSDARDNGEFRMIIGDTGCGKTYVANIFKRKFPNDVFYLKVSKLDDIRMLLLKLLDVTGSATPPRTGVSWLLTSVCSNLQNMYFEGRKPVLVFDESEYMKQSALCLIKELYDYLIDEGHYCGIVLVGHHQLSGNIENLRRRNKDGIPQFCRRTKFGMRRLPKIDRNFTQFMDGIEDRKLRKFLQNECENYGELHDVLVPALREADRTGEAVTEDFVRRLLNMPNPI
ncbi:MAG: ATP-binding protein [Tannerella sp.]|jgi:type II secretory pathway predicted ATPase ExeA|nr:ATP-binding protein [Tannerella sp.]